jgi:hypothetical protein
VAFHPGGFEFRSTALSWMGITNASAEVRGTGQCGTAECRFILTAVDGRPDRISITVWTSATDDAYTQANPLYSISNRSLTKGSIIVHKAK